MIEKSAVIFSAISGVSTILWHLSESALLTDMQEIKQKYLKINSKADKNKSNFCVSYLLSFASPIFPIGKFKVKIFLAGKFWTTLNRQYTCTLLIYFI